MNRSGLIVAVALAALLVACSGKQKRADMFAIDATTSEGAALAKWFDGAEPDAMQAAKAAGNSPTSRFVRSEIAYYDGDVELAFDDWVAMLTEHPAHPLTRLATARLYAARDEVADFETRIAPVFDKIDYSAIGPLTRAYVSMLQQTIAYRDWKASDSNDPFDSAQFGFPAKWLATPNLSPWRLSDFDKPFAPETHPDLAPRYLSPTTAVDVPINRERVRPFWSGGITLYPGFRSSGIYYLETVATVEEARDYLVFGNFVAASKVWIDGELVFERPETDYESGKRFRRVRLEAGTHRVLVKMGFQTGYRDWFDLTFIPENGRTDDSGIDFTFACMDDRELAGCHSGTIEQAGVKLLSETQFPAELEPIFVKDAAVNKASDVALWVTMVAAYFGGQQEYFKAAWAELADRRPNFAAGWLLWAEEVQTLWQVPSKLRDARALQAVRKAHELDPDSLRNQATLGGWLTSKGEEREARNLLKLARDGAYDGERLRSFTPLTAWARYLDGKDWNVEAEKAWQAVLDADPANCRAAGELQAAFYGRLDYRKPDQITPRAAECPGLEESWRKLVETDAEARIEYARRDAERRPLRADNAKKLAQALARSGDIEGALAQLEKARKRIPTSAVLLAELVDRAFAVGDEKRALKLLADFEKAEGSSAWLLWKRATIEGKLPLSDLLPDGHAAAMKAVAQGQEKALSNDEAYFVVDFAARRYFPDGSKVTLTHTVVRVMTKGAIDRYGEQTLPGSSRPLLVRTIKQDGTVREPEQTAGKSTLSMPGLAEGDFVEVAYLEYDGPESPPSTVEGVRFFFRMANISTLHSEYVVIGDIANFLRENDAPAPTRFQYKGLPALRFVAKNNPRPRSEPRSPAVEEFLPWVQMYRPGEQIDDIEAFRRDVREAILDSSKLADAFDDAVGIWTKGELGDIGSRDWVKSIFYAVTPLVSEPSLSARSFGTDVNHVILLKEGNTMLVLKAVLDYFTVPNDVYIVKSAFQIPKVYPLREGGKYGSVLLRVQTPDGDVWLSPDGPDAMFNAVSPALIGQPAVCATCVEREELVVPNTVRSSKQDISASGKLDAAGTLSGRVAFTFDGGTAVGIRSGLRGRTDETSRSKFVDALAAGVFTGAAATGYDIQGELNPDEPLRVFVDFKREAFAREVSPGQFQIETTLFRDALASAFGGLPDRVTPLFVGFTVDNRYHLDIELDGWSGAKIAGQSGERRFDSRFGNARRVINLSGNKLTVDASTNLPIQRVSIADYKEFTRWGLSVEQSAGLLVKLQK